MMSRPQPKVAPEEAAAPAEKPKSSSEHVEDLERRLAMLGGVTTPEEPKADEAKRDDPPPAFAVAVADTKTPTTEIKGGKTALLVRFSRILEVRGTTPRMLLTFLFLYSV